MGHELGSATDIDRFFVFRTVYTNFHLDRERQFLELSYRRVGQKYRQKMVILSFVGYLGEFESDSQTVWTGIYTANEVSPNGEDMFFKMSYSPFSAGACLRRCFIPYVLFP